MPFQRERDPVMNTDGDASTVAIDLVAWLGQTGHRLVLVESCTCGMAAAMIGGVPGASHVFCGSLVTYRESAKQDWLSVPASTIADFTAESPETTAAMATLALQQTPDATIAAAITGHLGPGAPTATDGRIHCTSLHRGSVPQTHSVTFQLSSRERVQRQTEAARRFLSWIVESAAKPA